MMISSSSGSGDHPRSRGVYNRMVESYYEDEGSSPLARGLRPKSFEEPSNCRIIPARAGFTARSSPARGPSWDHPRSRGVYLPLTHPHPRSTGSSPLARGLPDMNDSARTAILDHPRSRGVYKEYCCSGSSRSGSSPLARGLPRRASPLGWRARIIPARAGFTGTSPRQSEPPKDHPRSRGVYRRGGRLVSARTGSSPLARGLQSKVANVSYVTWIIPARAGFTRSPHGTHKETKDHPRSRGVYRPRGSRIPRRRGSSPLARGLRDDYLDGGHDARSRGVYAVFLMPSR